MVSASVAAALVAESVVDSSSREARDFSLEDFFFFFFLEKSRLNAKQRVRFI